MDIKKDAWEAVAGAAIVGVAQLALKKLTAAAGEEVGKKATEFASAHIEKLQQSVARKELFADLIHMGWDDKRNIIGYLRDAIVRCNEHHVVTILAEVPKDASGSRIDALTYLNAHLPQSNVTPEEEGAVLMELLNDNGAAQLAQKVYRGVKATYHNVDDAAESAATSIANFRRERKARKGRR